MEFLKWRNTKYSERNIREKKETEKRTTERMVLMSVRNGEEV
jgi:hypothetical protein